MDDYTRLKSVGGGLFKEFVAYGGLVVCLELILQLEEDQTSGTPLTTSIKMTREPLYQCVKDIAT